MMCPESCWRWMYKAGYIWPTNERRVTRFPSNFGGEWSCRNSGICEDASWKWGRSLETLIWGGKVAVLLWLLIESSQQVLWWGYFLQLHPEQNQNFKQIPSATHWQTQGLQDSDENALGNEHLAMLLIIEVLDWRFIMTPCGLSIWACSYYNAQWKLMLASPCRCQAGPIVCSQFTLNNIQESGHCRMW